MTRTNKSQSSNLESKLMYVRIEISINTIELGFLFAISTVSYIKPWKPLERKAQYE